MHYSSYEKMRAFLATYSKDMPAVDRGRRLLEVGSKSYSAHDTYKQLCIEAGFAYSGLDLESGANVDIVPQQPFVWPEIADDSFSAAISGQTFEHNPFFWVTLCEMARVLVPGGYLCVIAPGGGSVHRYPVDCYRFYPDSWTFLAALAGLEMIETYFEQDATAIDVPGGQWRDTMLIARKPLAASETARERREQVVRPFRDGFGVVDPAPAKAGPAIAAYLATVEAQPMRRLRARIARRIAPFGVGRVYTAEKGA